MENHNSSKKSPPITLQSFFAEVELKHGVNGVELTEAEMDIFSHNVGHENTLNDIKNRQKHCKNIEKIGIHSVFRKVNSINI